MNRGRLSEFVNETVRFIGRVTEVSGVNLTLEAPDGGEVMCSITSDVPTAKFVEVVAMVLPDGSLQQTDFLFELGDNINMQLVNDAINLSFHPQIRSTQTAEIE